MSALWAVARFDLREEVRRISTWVYFAIFFAFALGTMAAMAGAWEEMDMGSRVLLANSPMRIGQVMLLISLFAVPITSGLAGRAVHRDFEMRIHPLFFTTPVSKAAYVGGRYVAAVLTNLLVLLAVPLGLFAGTLLPAVDPDRIGAFRFTSYAVPFALLVVPNVLMTAALFLVLAALTRRALANQVGGLVLLLGYGLSRLFTTAIEADWFTWLSDPFGSAPTNHATRYWTVAEQNLSAFPLTTPLLVNRALWLAVGFGVLAYGIARFRFAQFLREDDAPRSPAAAAAPSLAARLRLPDPRRAFGAGARWTQLLEMTRDGTRRILRGVWFWILAAVCMVFVLISGSEIGSIYGTRTYPVTYQVLELHSGFWILFGIVIVTIYAGELVWEERDAGIAQIHDSMPVPSWIPFASKTLALSGMMAVLLTVAMLTGMLIQAARGYFHFEIGLYLAELFGQALPMFVLMIILAVTVQSLVNHKYLGHLVI
ncbi:ABC transporter permease, partial [Longimicrobium sp.]|uniref:ABC transporter permease n=1 Tax=Longimicrobium sp. TaxID=2029185 RepID=UPI002E368C53